MCCYPCHAEVIEATPEQLRSVLAGKRLSAVRRKGKHFWFQMEDGETVLWHFGVYGWPCCLCSNGSVQ